MAQQKHLARVHFLILIGPLTMPEHHSNARDEQFWFTAATVAFNTVLLGKDVTAPKIAPLFASALVSAFVGYLILTRWLAAASKMPTGAPNWETVTFYQRLSYTRREILAAIRHLPCVVAELSGALFYLLLICLT